jgi:hypothetical protein
MDPTRDTKTALVDDYTLSAGQIIGEAIGTIVSGLTGFAVAYSTTLGQESAKSTARSTGQIRHRRRRRTMPLQGQTILRGREVAV